MKRSWNPIVWAGFALTLVSLPLYFIFLVRYQSTREFPWVTFLLFALAAFMLALGTWRAYKRPQEFRGRVAGPILSTLSFLSMILFFSDYLFRRQKSSLLDERSSARPAGPRLHSARLRRPAGYTFDPRGSTVRLERLAAHSRSHCRRWEKSLRHSPDLLSWILVTSLQLRVTEFPGASPRIQRARHPRHRDQRGRPRRIRTSSANRRILIPIPL